MRASQPDNPWRTHFCSAANPGCPDGPAAAGFQRHDAPEARCNEPLTAPASRLAENKGVIGAVSGEPALEFPHFLRDALYVGPALSPAKAGFQPALFVSRFARF